MHSPRGLLATVGASLLLTATPAAASGWNPPGDRSGVTVLPPESWQQRALMAAQQRWHPTCGRLALAFGDPTSAGVTRDDPEGAGQLVPDAAGWTALGSCTINLNAAVAWRPYPRFCTMVLHEAGHSVGLPDTDTPGIMSMGQAVSRDIGHVRRSGHWRRVVHWHGAPAACIRPLDRR